VASIASVQAGVRPVSLCDGISELTSDASSTSSRAQASEHRVRAADRHDRAAERAAREQHDPVCGDDPKDAIARIATQRRDLLAAQGRGCERAVEQEPRGREEHDDPHLERREEVVRVQADRSWREHVAMEDEDREGRQTANAVERIHAVTQPGAAATIHLRAIDCRRGCC
jgi:hypothetical protein